METDSTPTVISVGDLTGDEDLDWWRTKLRAALDALKEGGLVAFPTETVYGLGADATRPDSVARIFEAKQRPPGHPLIVHVSSARHARRLAAMWSDREEALAEAFWPGPLTLIVERGPSIPDVVTGGLATVGLRAPAHPVAEMLIRLSGVPIAAPSANPHQGVSPTRAEHVVTGLGSKVDVIIDAGPTHVGLESTVLSLTEAVPTILRPGGVAKSELEQILGTVRYGDEVSVSDDTRQRPSPGMADKHYAPRAEVVVGPLAELRERVPQSCETGWILLDGGTGCGGASGESAAEDPTCRLGPDPEAYAAGLYDALHRLDDAGCQWIGVEAPPDGEVWRAIWDRLRRAAG